MPATAKNIAIKAGKTGFVEERIEKVKETSITVIQQSLQDQQMAYEVASDGQFAFAVYFSEDPARDGEDTTKWERVYPLFQVGPKRFRNEYVTCIAEKESNDVFFDFIRHPFIKLTSSRWRS